MTTPAHINYDPTKPSGASTPTVFGDTDLVNNLKALRDLVITGKVLAFIQSRTTGTGPDANRPQLLTWMNGTIGYRWNITWTGNNPTTVVDEWSNDSGVTWAAIASQVNTFDASNNITASTNSGGFVTVVFELWGKLLKIISDFATHSAAAGTAVHGLGTLSTQNANAAALSGTSAFDGATIGASARPTVDGKRVREEFHDYGALTNGATVTVEWDKYAHVSFAGSATTSDAHTIAFSGLPASGITQSIIVEVLAGRRSVDAKWTYPTNAKWIGGASARPVDTALATTGGRDFFVVTCRDGGARLEWQYLGAGG